MLRNKNIVVTGANRGIGKNIVEKCMENGANVWACIRTITPDTEKWIDELNSKYDSKIKAVKLDLASEESIKEAGTIILEDKVTIDGIVNNAGVIGQKNLFSMTEISDIRDTFQVNFFGPMFFTQRLLKRMMRQKHGSIVNISSIASIDGEPGQFGYVSSKAAINGATKKLSHELGNFGIRVNAVAPGVTDTDMASMMSDDVRVETTERTALKRLGKPEEIADMCVFLLSDRSEYITGQIIRVDGGSV